MAHNKKIDESELQALLKMTLDSFSKVAGELFGVKPDGLFIVAAFESEDDQERVGIEAFSRRQWPNVSSLVGSLELAIKAVKRTETERQASLN